MKRSTNGGVRLSRRDVLKAGALSGVAPFTGGGLTAQVASASESRRLGKSRKKTGDLILVNGRIHTMDDRNRVARSVTIREGRFAEVGDHPGRHSGDAPSVPGTAAPARRCALTTRATATNLRLT